MSHTKDLIDEAMLKINDYLQEKRDKEENGSYNDERLGNIILRRLYHALGGKHFTEKFGVHVMRVNEWVKYQKTTGIQFYTLACVNPQPFDEFYEILEDDNSKKEYDWYVKYRTASVFLGERAYDLFTPRITKEMYKKYEMQIKDHKNGYFNVDGFYIKLNEHWLLINTFLIEQYRLPNLVEPTEGDIVFDVGACLGDTAFWFKKYIGNNGKVFAFEPVGYNFAILKENIERNKITNIIPEKLALSDKEGTLSISGTGGSASLPSDRSEKVKVTTIDKFVEKQELDCVDFIKMDIEGAELGALKGAENTLRKFKPKLAICVYHREDDLITIPKYIKSVNENYKFFMRSNSTGFIETVLYAINTV